MSDETPLGAAIRIANEADAAFSAAVKAEGWKSRWDMAITPQHSQFLRDAYFAKVGADRAMHEAFEQVRRDRGLTQEDQ